MLNIDFHKLAELFVYNPKEPLIFSTGLFLFLFMGFISIFYIFHRQHNLKIAFVILFSLFFYYKSSGIYFLLLITATIVDYTLANFIYKAEKDWEKRAWLIFSLVLNIGLLAYFKYTNFLYEIFCNLATKPYEPFNIFLPVGVSFFTFQSLSYTIDIYRKEIKPVESIFDYAFFVSFFPQLVAGPIVRARDFIPQINKPVIVTKEMFGRGLFLIMAGLFKKVVISDFISTNFVDRVFDNPTLYTGLENLFGVYGYALQIYCDFSGYSDMAIGIALLFGYELCLNFDSPYQSSSITEFWRRWHISLSTWLRDYLYISLGGNRKGRARTYFNQFITMVLGGLWHGAAFRFILWGALHGVALGIDKYFKEVVKLKPTVLTKTLGIIITFHFVCFCWIFFRADNMQIAGGVISQILFHFTPSVALSFVTGYKNVLLIMLLGYILHFIPKNIETKAREWVTAIPLAGKVALMALVIVLVIQAKGTDIQPFIYFQF
jgi:alginate O-acetyltransferase complex protein AlgI